jgi:hypothetical protein
MVHSNIHADASGSCVNIHFCERWHRCRGDERAHGNGSDCEFLHGYSFRSYRCCYAIQTALRGQLFRFIFVACAMTADI